MADRKIEKVNGFVVAKRRGFDGTKIREPGEKFPFRGILGDWMEMVDEKETASTDKSPSK